MGEYLDSNQKLLCSNGESYCSGLTCQHMGFITLQFRRQL